MNQILLIIALLLFALPAGAKESPQSLLTERTLPTSSLLEHSEVVTRFPNNSLLNEGNAFDFSVMRWQ